MGKPFTNASSRHFAYFNVRAGKGTGNFLKDEKVASPHLGSRFRGNDAGHMSGEHNLRSERYPGRTLL